MIKLSAVIITYNEARDIGRCLDSLQSVADEIIVVDSFSTDATEKICTAYGNVTFVKQEFLGYIEQKNFAITQARYDHILSLDGDEALSQELIKSISALKLDWTHDGYYMHRYNNFCGQWIKHSDWYPDKKLRAFKKNAGIWSGINPHDSFKLHPAKSSKKLKGDLLHWNYATYSEYNQKIEKFSSISAQAYYDLGKKAPIWKILLNPSWAFFKAYFLCLGFLDGFNGLVISIQTANITFLKYAKLRELLRQNSH